MDEKTWCYSCFSVQKDACGQTQHGPACCTTEIFNSYTSSLANDLKILFDTELAQLKSLFLHSSEQLDRRWNTLIY